MSLKPTLKLWAGVGILLVSAVLGVMGFLAFERYIQEQGINLNLRLFAVFGALGVIAGGLLAFFRPRRRKEEG